MYFVPYSLSDIITDIGVRNSWDTSELNWRSLIDARSNDSNISLKTRASLWTSSFPSSIVILLLKSALLLIVSAVSIISRTGFKELLIIK